MTVKKKSKPKMGSSSKGLTTTIKNCTFTVNSEWDADTIQVILSVARGLENLTKIFKSQKIIVDAMVKVGETGEKKCD